MKRENITMRAWMNQATPDQKKQLAAGAKTSVMHLWHIAKGRSGVGPELAQRLVHASLSVDVTPLDQVALCSVCARCPLAK